MRPRRDGDIDHAGDGIRAEQDTVGSAKDFDRIDRSCSEVGEFVGAAYVSGGNAVDQNFVRSGIGAADEYRCFTAEPACLDSLDAGSYPQRIESSRVCRRDLCL